MELGKIPQETQKVVEDFESKLHQQRLQKAGEKILKEVEIMKKQEETRRVAKNSGDFDNTQFDI